MTGDPLSSSAGRPPYTGPKLTAEQIDHEVRRARERLMQLSPEERRKRGEDARAMAVRPCGDAVQVQIGLYWAAKEVLDVYMEERCLTFDSQIHNRDMRRLRDELAAFKAVFPAMATAQKAEFKPTLPRDGVFAPPRDVEWLVLTLRTWGNAMFARFGHPVWLVGGALTHIYPRDIDIRVILPDDEYVARFGPWQDKHGPVVHDDTAEAVMRWIGEMGKQNRWVAKNCGLNVDFQVQCESEIVHFRYADNQRRRIDTINESAEQPEQPGAGG